MSGSKTYRKLAPKLEARHNGLVRVIAKRMVREFWARYKDAEGPLKAWYAEAKRATWKGPADIKARYVTASFVSSDRVVFNIGGNKYRLVVALRYDLGIVFVRFIGTHREYNRIDVNRV